MALRKSNSFTYQLVLCAILAAAATRTSHVVADDSKADARTAKPNIILLVVDDHRWDSLGCMGNPVVKTPNIDAMASEGVVFENFFCTTSICATSRASILTGQYARRHGIHGFREMLKDESFAETFHDNGPTDMVAAMRAYREIGFEGPIRPDHVPQLEGEDDGEPGYTMKGRLFAYGYLRGLMQATEA